MKHLSALLLALLFLMPGHAACAAPTATPPDDSDDDWVIMPAGGRSAYMGIHGGTMPVSLLVSGDGRSLLTFVGRTGNDFLELLRRTDMPLPSLLNATMSATGPLPPAYHLVAGNATSSMPVINLGGSGMAGYTTSQGRLQPFGFSPQPLSIEGQVTKPEHPSPAKLYRLSFQPQYFSPRRHTGAR